MSPEEDAAFVYDKIQEWYEKHAPVNSVLRNNRTYWSQHPTVLAKNAYMYAVAEFRKKLENEECSSLNGHEVSHSMESQAG